MSIQLNSAVILRGVACTRFPRTFSHGIIAENRQWHSVVRKLITCRQYSTEFKARNVVLLRKTTRYEHEKRLHQYEEDDLKNYLINKGSDYHSLRKRHFDYQKRLDEIHQSLSHRGLDVRLCNRKEYNDDVIKWADAIVTAGGDGTFLLAASKIKNQRTPVIGVNTDAIRSEGYLCLPKKYSLKFDEALDKLLNNQFEWCFRNRIRVTLSGSYSDEAPVDLHNQELEYSEHRFHEHIKENETERSAVNLGSARDEAERPPLVLPVLALNEVFIGESLSARVSFYEISVDGSSTMKQKSSGVTICTGTGSTSWYFNINHLQKESVREILRIAKEIGPPLNHDDDTFVRKVTRLFNSTLRFRPNLLKMAFVIRDPVVNGLCLIYFPSNSLYGMKARLSSGKVTWFLRKVSLNRDHKLFNVHYRMSLRSRMWDARVVIDGSSSYSFNDGACVDLEVHEEDALRCVTLR